MKQRWTRRVLGATPFFAMNDRIRYRMALDCGHTVARSSVQPQVCCEECKAESPPPAKRNWQRR